MIKVEGVVYDYATSRALHGVSFEVRPGAVLALVGPNGAGKSTLLRCTAALDEPTEGRITVAGLDTRDDPRGVHAALGYLPDFFGLYDELSVRRALIYAARSRGVSAAAAPAAAERAAARVDLSDRLEQRAGELSRGLRQRLAIAQTLVHAPKVLLLDEPASGLDPEARASLSGLMTRLAGEGMTIVVSSHILAELEDYCTEMLMLRAGAIAGGGVLSTGAATQATPEFDVVLATPVTDAVARVQTLGYAATLGLDGALRLRVDGGPAAEAEALARLVGAGLPVCGFTPVRRTLEQAYLAQARGEAA